MLTVHYTVHHRKGVEEGKVVESEGSKALSVIKALEFQLGNLENLSLPYHSPDLGVTIETVTPSVDPKVVVTFKKSEAPNG